MNWRLLAGASALAILAAGQAFAATDRSVTWQAQIGDTATVQTQSNGGAGIKIAIVDSGVLSTNAEVAGRLSTASSCAAVTFACSNGFNDDNGHGTAVAAIAAGHYNPLVIGAGMSGVAPNATIIAEKSLSKVGSGYDSDVASGIMKATDAGAQVINLSLTYIPTTAVVKAINYAAAHNVVIVWAAGNSGVNINGGANTSGLTAAALQRLIFVGSVNASNVVSTFSNKPGTASVYAGSTKASYAQLWLMAPGENIAAPGIQFGANVMASWTGTSMSAPEVSGAVALLEATWPVLIRNGTVSAVLFASATDLGAKGIDNTYGNGLTNIARAFQPIGSTTVIGTNGQPVTVTLLSGSVMTSGALGSLPGLKAQLSAYTTFDDFQRNFTSNLSGLVVTPRGGGSSAGAESAGAPVVSTRVSFAGGGYMLMSQTRPASFADIGWADEAPNRLLGVHDRGTSYVALVDGSGNMLAMGHGVSGAAAFASAAWGPDSATADQDSRLGVSTALMGLAQGGRIGAVGVGLGSRVRFAAGWSATDPAVGSGRASDRTRSNASAAMLGINARLTARLTAAVSVSTLSEQNGLLGATYDGAGLLTLGASHRSRSVSVSSAFDLGGGRSLLVDAAWADTNGANLAGGLIRDVSPLKARAFGVSVVQQDAFKAGDRMTLSVRKPLRVTSGQASLAVTSVDQDGYSSTGFTPVSLTPDGDETNVSLAYWTPVSSHLSLGGGLDLRKDARNIKGQNDAGVRLALNANF